MQPNPLISFRETSNCQSTIFSVVNQIHNNKLSIEEIGNSIPSSIIVQGLNWLTNTYMNQTGCVYLRHSREEPEALDPNYYKQYFPPEEMVLLKAELFKFVRQNDSSKIYSFFQRVRPNADADYKWYLTSTRLYPQITADQSSLKLLHIAIEVGNTYYAETTYTQL
ncbi:hypothetical protein HH214_14440 [Mucilaginibacter robiniae]|uniref:Uncharacterized protein n=1 Tax=Mucilaginibacter robiniae TaxID=2728022 RepID=A0A7L5E1R6_9SPHI|nr:hypothetical protein [Mucilaginibacter robiniae]QJD96981.1 hypothetical protein HH214_14440 [Mucilaginibacter robiniae]